MSLAQIANFRREFLQLKSDYLAICVRYMLLRLELAIYRAAKAGFNPGQLRIPVGQPDGGQWADGSGETAREKSIVTVHSRTHITIHRPDGSSQTRTDGSRSWRNNNPGNIISGRFADRHEAIGDNHGFAVFPDERTGNTASGALLKTRTYSRLTIDEAIARRSPPQSNDTERVQDNVRKIGGFSGAEIIGELDQEELSRLVDAIKKTEGWWEGTVVDTPAP